MKKIAMLILCLVLAIAIMPFGQTAHAADEIVGTKLLYVNAPKDWEKPSVWAFAEDGTAAFDAWPGQELTADPENEGWYYTYLPSNLSDKVIISANAAAVQTGDYAVENKNSWITVNDNKEATISYKQETKGLLPKYVKMINLKVFVPKDWDAVNYWAWSHPDGTNAFAKWPGNAAKLETDGWYSLQVPAFVNKVGINAKAGEVQTADLDIDATKFSDKFIPTVYVVVDGKSEDMKKAGGEVTYGEKPDMTPKFTIYAKIPSDWALPCVWAWSHPDGTNAFANWPGNEMTEDGEWYSIKVPEFVNKLLINGNLGTVQTIDFDIEAKDIYVVVTKANAEGKYEAEISYEKPNDNSTSTNVWIYVGIGVVIVVAAAVALVLIKKRKTK